jgi:pimeloyl-ACP methyl ester carboxylesterase
MLCTADVFAPQMSALWHYGPVTVASTLEGETIAGMAEAILRTAPPRFALAGLSMGGYISLEIMRQAPERVLKLALLCTSARPDTPEQTAAREPLVAAARVGDFRGLLTQALRLIVHPSLRDDVGLIEGQVRMGLTFGVEGFARQVEAISGRTDSRPILYGITVPTLVLVGDSDPLTPPECSEELAEMTPGARLVVVPRCGHAATLERPEEVTAALLEWIMSASPVINA